MSNYKVCSCGFLFVEHYKVEESSVYLTKKKIARLGGEEHLVDMFGNIRDICYCKHLGKAWINKSKFEINDKAYTNKCKKCISKVRLVNCRNTDGSIAFVQRCKCIEKHGKMIECKSWNCRHMHCEEKRGKCCFIPTKRSWFNVRKIIS